MLRKAWLEQELKKARLGLKECAITRVKEKKKEKVMAQAEVGGQKPPLGAKMRAGLVCKTIVKKPVGLHKCPVNKWMEGTNKAGVRYGPGYKCWQCEHRFEKLKAGGHAHSCKKVMWARPA